MCMMILGNHLDFVGMVIDDPRGTRQDIFLLTLDNLYTSVRNNS